MSNNLKTVLFGGSFNPPTRAHISVIEGLSKRFDKVIVMPTYISPFKLDANVLSGTDRIELLREACRDYKNVEISDYEISGKEISYTYKTLEYLSSREKNIYLALGTDNIKEFDRWKNTLEICKIATLYFVPRPYFSVVDDDLKKLSEMNCRYEIADFVGENGSSTLVKAAVAFGKLDEVTPANVADFINRKSLYADYAYINDLYERFHVKYSRQIHIYGTVKAAIILAAKNGADKDKALLAAMLHDIGKYVTPEELKELGIVCDDEALTVASSIRHCYTGEAIARKVVGIKDEDILGAIRYHTTGNKDMSVLQKVIFCADYIEEGRTTPGVDRVRKIIYDNLNEGMKLILDDTIKYLESKGAEIDVRTLVCRDWLEKIIKKEKNID